MRNFEEIIDDGGWCWFHEPRVFQAEEDIWIGAVSSGYLNPKLKGDVIALRRNVQTGRTTRYVLHSSLTKDEQNLWANDHNAPALLQLPNRKILAAYTLHGKSNIIYFRTFSPLFRRWSAEREFVLSKESKITYSNLVYLSDEERIYNFFRGLDNSWKPSWALSDAKVLDWKIGGILINFQHEKKHRPYLKLCSNGKDTINFAYTEGHPRDFPNSIYHISYRSGVGLCNSAGKFIAPLESGLVAPTEGTLVFQGSVENVAWVVAVNDYHQKGLFVLFSVRHVRSDNDIAHGDSDLSYWLATWNGTKWESKFVAKAGPQIYKGEDDYSGLFTQHPDDPNIFFISTKVNPINQVRLKHWELFRGYLSPTGHLTWNAITADSDQDNLRPIVTAGDFSQVCWLYGEMVSYSDYAFKVVANKSSSVV